MLPYKDDDILKVEPELNFEFEEKNSQLVLNHITPERLFECWNETMNQIDALCNKKKYSHAIQVVNSLISILSNVHEYCNEFLFDVTFLTSFEQSLFFKYIPNFLLSINNNIKLTVLKFFICFSTISCDFIDIIIPIFISNGIFPHYLKHENNSDSITSYFYILIGLFSQYSGQFNQYLIDTNFFDSNYFLFIDSNLNVKFQIVNFINRMTQNCSDNIQFKNSLKSFLLLINQLKDFLRLFYQKKYEELNSLEKEFALSILDIFQNLFFIPDFKEIIFKENISQFMLDQIVNCDKDVNFFDKFFHHSLQIINYDFDNIQQLENVEKFSLLCIKINYFLNNGSFFEKPKIIKTVISMIRKCKKDFNSIFISLSDSLKSYINAETNLHDEIVSCLEFMGVTDIFD